MKNKNKINIAIVGLGNIGSYLYKYLSKNKSYFFKKTNVIPNILYVSAKNSYYLLLNTFINVLHL